jgi:hypothetical protein
MMTEINKPGDKPKPDNTLPGQPGKPDNTLPGKPDEKPDNTLPGKRDKLDKTTGEEEEELPPGHEHAWRPEDGPEPPPPGING